MDLFASEVCSHLISRSKWCSNCNLTMTKNFRMTCRKVSGSSAFRLRPFSLFFRCAPEKFLSQSLLHFFCGTQFPSTHSAHECFPVSLQKIFFGCWPGKMRSPFCSRMFSGHSPENIFPSVLEKKLPCQFILHLTPASIPSTEFSQN